MERESAPEAVAGRIGPNAVLRLAEALDARYGRARTAEVFGAAGQSHFLDVPPQAMVDECSVTALYVALPKQFGPAAAAEIAARAGVLTGEYLLEHRIPKPAQRLMKLMPAELAARTLLAAVERHAWTFTGSGTFARAAVHGPPVPGAASVRWRLTVRDCPICRGARATGPQCWYYAATFERIFRAVVAGRTQVAETACHASGAPACTFDVSW